VACWFRPNSTLLAIFHQLRDTTGDSSARGLGGAGGKNIYRLAYAIRDFYLNIFTAKSTLPGCLTTWNGVWSELHRG
jgi:hypothetical protein